MVSQLALPVADVPWALNTCVGSSGGVFPRQIDVAMTQACTWIPLACALSISVWSGSNGAGSRPACSARAAAERLQKQSPRRTTWATIALALMAFVAATTSSIWPGVYMPSPNASTQYPRN